MSEIFNKNGSLSKRAPKKYECKDCQHITSKPATLKTAFAKFNICDACGGSLKKRDVYIEWDKRSTGQWEMEEKIIAYVKEKEEVSKDNMTDYFEERKNRSFPVVSIFSKTLGDLVWNGKLKVRREEGKVFYSL
ncbi:hypothetical protein WKH56_19925 [Priestia sp. SB1]|uniref:hypothetical protein n=1 Tax=Priestia sp. SB1 TaxID=3132359 RepID=UPI0031769D11